MRQLFFCIAVIFCSCARAQEFEEQRSFGEPDGSLVLRVISSTDTALFEPIIMGFLADNPAVGIEYFVTGSADLNQAIMQPDTNYDIAISSAMDLQTKLVNDGYALEIDNIDIPDWAHWRHSVFGFTKEPATILLSKSAFAGLQMPSTRQDLISVLRSNPERFRGKIGTYDIRASGLGYLFATQDARTSETYWRLMEVMGNLDAKLYCCSGQMIDDLASGRLSVAYNVIGSYARARSDLDRIIEIVEPADFTTVMMRTALVTARSVKKESAINFLKYLISARWNDADFSETSLPSLAGQPGEQGLPKGVISLGPGLLTYLDSLKRQKFTSEWNDALVQK
ncbi:MAG: ABC transporter substrate-binding protein [Rhodobacteraceae bacterium]|nr:ABC transporter substrate-binding protein [Paracoccaceae bacterium]